jgi:hypothetical protein
MPLQLLLKFWRSVYAIFTTLCGCSICCSTYTQLVLLKKMEQDNVSVIFACCSLPNVEGLLIYSDCLHVLRKRCLNHPILVSV